MSCLEKIIGIRANCTGEDTESLSGYFMTDYPGITIQAAANYNDEKTVTGFNYLVDVRRRAMLRLNNDIQQYIAANYRVNFIPGNTWSTGQYSSTIKAAGVQGNRRGIVVYKQRPECRFYKMQINRIRILADETIDTTLKIADTIGVVFNVNVSLVAGEVKELIVNKIFDGNEVQVTLPSDIKVYSNKPNCGVGCGGTIRNECVRVNGISNGVANTSESYGIELDVMCVCDLNTLVCDLASNNLIGQAAYELCGAMFYDEMTKNHRLNYLTIYKGDEIKEQAAAGFTAYNQYLTNAMNGMRNYLVNGDGGCKCIDCSGANIKSNV